MSTKLVLFVAALTFGPFACHRSHGGSEVSWKTSADSSRPSRRRRASGRAACKPSVHDPGEDRARPR